MFLRSAVVRTCTNLHLHTCYSNFEIHSRIYTVIYKQNIHTHIKMNRMCSHETKSSGFSSSARSMFSRNSLREIMLFIGKTIGRSLMISSNSLTSCNFSVTPQHVCVKWIFWGRRLNDFCVSFFSHLPLQT